MIEVAKSQITISTIEDGQGYTIQINGGVRGISYAADGSNPTPSVVTSPYTVELINNGKIVTPYSYSWLAGGNLSGTGTSSTFTPVISKTYITGDSYVAVSVKPYEDSAAITQVVPIVSSKFADGLDWIADWDGTKTEVKGEKIVSPRIFAGTNTGTGLSPNLTGVALGRDVLTGSNNTIGIVGYKKNIPVFKLDQDANFLVSKTGSTGDVVNGTSNGIYFDGSDLYIAGKVKIKSGSTIGSSDINVDELIELTNEANNNALNAESTAAEADKKAEVANGKLENILVPGDEVLIDGGKISASSITANAIKAGQFTIRNEELGRNTFSIDANGDVSINGTLQSDNFSEFFKTGYRITPDGDAILNQAKVRGDVILPNAGMTNYGDTIGNENLINETLNTYKDYSTGQYFTYVMSRTALSSLGLAAGDTVTFRVYIKATGEKGAKARISHYYGDGTTYASDYGNVIFPGEEGYSTVTATLREDAHENGIYVAIASADTSTTDSAIGEYKEAKFEKGSEATPWCPSNEDQKTLNPVRIWAGADYGFRDSAPFRVHQDGSVFASNGTFTGLLRGVLDSGDVQIYNNAITVHAPGAESEVIRIDAGQTTLNTDVVFGSDNDKRIVYANSNRQIDFNDMKLNLNTTASTGIEVAYSSTGDWHSSLKLLEPTGGSWVTAGYSGGANLGTLWITHQGSKAINSNYGDIAFRRRDINEDVDVSVSGNLSVRNSIKSNKQNIEIRSVSNEGWGFYAT